MFSIKQQDAVKDIFVYYIYQLYFVQIPNTIYKDITQENDKLFLKNLRFAYDDLIKQSTQEYFQQTINQIHRFFQNSLGKQQSKLTEQIFKKMIILTFIPEIKQNDYERDTQFNALKLLLLLINQQMKNYLDQKVTIEQIIDQTKNPQNVKQYKNIQLKRIVNIVQKAHQLLEIQLTGKNVHQYVKQDVDEEQLNAYKKQNQKINTKLDILQKKNLLLIKQNTLLKSKVNKLVDTMNKLVNRPINYDYDQTTSNKQIIQKSNKPYGANNDNNEIVNEQFRRSANNSLKQTSKQQQAIATIINQKAQTESKNQPITTNRQMIKGSDYNIQKSVLQSKSKIDAIDTSKLSRLENNRLENNQTKTGKELDYLHKREITNLQQRSKQSRNDDNYHTHQKQLKNSSNTKLEYTDLNSELRTQIVIESDNDKNHNNINQFSNKNVAISDNNQYQYVYIKGEDQNVNQSAKPSTQQGKSIRKEFNSTDQNQQNQQNQQKQQDQEVLSNDSSYSSINRLASDSEDSSDDKSDDNSDESSDDDSENDSEDNSQDESSHINKRKTLDNQQHSNSFKQLKDVSTFFA